MYYQEFYRKSIDQPTQFWQEQAMQLEWFKVPKTILSKDKYDYDQWF